VNSTIKCDNDKQRHVKVGTFGTVYPGRFLLGFWGSFIVRTTCQDSVSDYELWVAQKLHSANYKTSYKSTKFYVP